jgi:hypothetical protein
VEIRSCEVCGNEDLEQVLDLGSHPMCDDLVPVGDNRRCEEYPINILFCARCITAHQRFQVPKVELFPESYHYRSRFTADVLNGMKEFVGSCAEYLGGLQGALVVDVGCNDGSLLDFFRAHGAKTVGVEPTGAGADALAKGHNVVQDFFSPEVARQVINAHGRAQIVTFTNVFAHIENLPELVESVVELLDENSVVVVENHYMGAVLERCQFDTFYHEHPRTYSLTSFDFIARQLGLEIVKAEFPSRYGGNIRITMAGSGTTGTGSVDLAAVRAQEAAFKDQFSDLRRGIARWMASKGHLIRTLVESHGPLRAKAFPGRAAILVKLLGLDESSISVVLEKPGSMKIGHYVPGTRIPIVSDESLWKSGLPSDPIVNFAWHISGEIRTYLEELGFRGSVIDILEMSDLEPLA